MIKFEHSVFALPFALTGALLAWRDAGFPRELLWAKVAWIVLAMVAARSVAMAFNRVLDADIDASNPRTKTRHLPAGEGRHNQHRDGQRSHSEGFAQKFGVSDPLPPFLDASPYRARASRAAVPLCKGDNKPSNLNKCILPLEKGESRVSGRGSLSPYFCPTSAA